MYGSVSTVDAVHVVILEVEVIVWDFNTSGETEKALEQDWNGTLSTILKHHFHTKT